MTGGNILVDLDGTLAKYESWKGPAHIGEPVPAMLERVKRWVQEGKDVRIFTARVSESRAANSKAEVIVARAAIQKWCEKHIGKALPVTCTKDFATLCIYDDRCVTVEPNTGRLLTNA